MMSYIKERVVCHCFEVYLWFCEGATFLKVVYFN